MDSAGAKRSLVVCADDYGLGPDTSRGILELAAARRISCSVLLVNSPYAEEAVIKWRDANPLCDLGWHPNLTLDSPILPPARVRSLVDPDGRFYPLGAFIKRWLFGRLDPNEIAIELQAQLDRYRELVGAEPLVVNSHQHCTIFQPIGRILAGLLKSQRPRPFVRRVRETPRLMWRIGGARVKRGFLSTIARSSNRCYDDANYPGNSVLAGICNHADARRTDFFPRWLKLASGQTVELMVHPGHWDETLVGRDCVAGDGCQERRQREHAMLASPTFAATVRGLGFWMVRPSEIGRERPGAWSHAA